MLLCMLLCMLSCVPLCMLSVIPLCMPLCMLSCMLLHAVVHAVFNAVVNAFVYPRLGRLSAPGHYVQPLRLGRFDHISQPFSGGMVFYFIFILLEDATANYGLPIIGGVWCSYPRCLLTPYTEWKIKSRNQNYFLPTIVDAVCNIATMPTVSMLSIS